MITKLTENISELFRVTLLQLQPYMSSSTVSYAETPLLGGDKTHGWRSASFILGVEIAERLAYYGIALNLISYLSGPLGQSTASAAANVNAWTGTTSLLPLLGALVADSFLGCYRTIVFASMLYILGLGLLTLSATLPSLIGSDCKSNNSAATTCSPPAAQLVLFYFSLYLVAVGQAGHTPCCQAFAADQFDSHVLAESIAKSSFFNWWFFAVCAGALITSSVLSYVQDNLSWVLGFGIPCLAMVVALAVFLAGTKTYRHRVVHNGKDPFVRIGKVFIAAFQNRGRTTMPKANGEESNGFLSNHNVDQFKFLDKALHKQRHLKEEEDEDSGCSVAEVEEAKAVLRLVPIWATCFIYALTVAQVSTFFTKQGATMDRTLISGIKIPAASLMCLTIITVLVFLPIYDRVLVPIARSFTRNPSGITMLQRIGTGIFLSVVMMIIAALVEIKRLKTAQEDGLVDQPSATVAMSVWWLVPQYVLYGIADAFAMVGLQEFFYDQFPEELKSLGLALYLSVFGVGSLSSSFLVAFIEKATSGKGRDSWFSDNLNRAHLDYFYWLLAVLGAMAFVAFWYFARSYIYKQSRDI